MEQKENECPHSISECGQGHVTLYFGPASIRMSLEEFRSFVVDAQECLHKFQAPRENFSPSFLRH